MERKHAQLKRLLEEKDLKIKCLQKANDHLRTSLADLNKISSTPTVTVDASHASTSTDDSIQLLWGDDIPQGDLTFQEALATVEQTVESAAVDLQTGDESDNDNE